MLQTILVVLLVLWLLGMVTSFTLYGSFHSSRCCGNRSGIPAGPGKDRLVSGCAVLSNLIMEALCVTIL